MSSSEYIARAFNYLKLAAESERETPRGVAAKYFRSLAANHFRSAHYSERAGL